MRTLNISVYNNYIFSKIFDNDTETIYNLTVGE